MQPLPTLRSTEGVESYIRRLVAMLEQREIRARREDATLAAGVASAAGFGLRRPPYIVGRYYDQATLATPGTIAGAANRCDLSMFVPHADITVDTVGVAVSTAVASATGKIVVYASAPNGWPDALLLETATLDFGTTGFKSVAAALTFKAGTICWLGLRHSSTATVRGITAVGQVHLGFGTAGTDTNPFVLLRRTITYATAAPASWVFTATELTANVVAPSIRMRAA